MNRAWEFDRYTNGRLKAEGIRITRAETFEQAMLKAVGLAQPHDVLVLRTTDEPGVALPEHVTCPHIGDFPRGMYEGVPCEKCAAERATANRGEKHG